MDINKNEDKKKKIIGKAWPVVLCLFLSLGIFMFLLSMEKKELDKYEKGYVAVAAEKVPCSTEITRDNVDKLFELAERPLADIPGAACLTPEELVGQYARADIDEGSIITQGMVGELSGIPEDCVVLSVDMEGLARSVAGTLRAGDTIDIYTVDTGADKEVTVTKVLSGVGIIRSFTGTGTSILKEDETAIAQYITIHVHKDAVETFYKSMENRKLEIVKYPKQ